MAMKFDLDNLNPGVWFEYDDKSFSVEVRVCAGIDLERIFKMTEKKRVEYKRNSRFEVFDIDNEKRDKLMWDFCVLNWKGIQDGKGKELACTIKNKIKLMKGSVLFASFIGDCLEKLSADSALIQKDREKNLPNSA